VLTLVCRGFKIPTSTHKMYAKEIKMKLSTAILTTILASSLAFGCTPALAETKKEVYTAYCQSLTTLARGMMINRQTGADTERLESLYGDIDDDMVDDMVESVGDVSIASTVEGKASLVAEYRDFIRNACRGSYGLN